LAVLRPAAAPLLLLLLLLLLLRAAVSTPLGALLLLSSSMSAGRSRAKDLKLAGLLVNGAPADWSTTFDPLPWPLPWPLLLLLLLLLPAGWLLPPRRTISDAKGKMARQAVTPLVRLASLFVTRVSVAAPR
jgi:hypothetical protein